MTDEQIKALRESHAELLAAITVVLAHYEDSMDGATNVEGKLWMPGVTDVHLVPDGSYSLSNVRAAHRRACALMEEIDG